LISYRSLIAALRLLRNRTRTGGVTIGCVLDTLGEAGFCLVALFLALPFLQPFIPLGPFSTAGGLAFIILGSQILRGYPEPILPERVRRITVAPQIFSLISGNAIKFLGWCRRHTRLRHAAWVTGDKGRAVMGAILLTGGLIMIIPFFGIPLNDFFPALAIVFVCVGELEQDGLMVWVALAWLAVGAVYCIALIVLLAMFGRGALSFLWG
jgi:hypothetical protein